MMISAVKVNKNKPCIMLALAGMRPGELGNGELNGERMVVIDHEEDSTWSPKTHTSYRRIF